MNILKGDKLENRYKLVGTLTALSPIHIGTGEEEYESRLINGSNNVDSSTQKDDVKASLIAVDHNNKPFLPGSALKGILRHYLRDVFISLDKPEIVQDVNYEKEDFKNITQDEQIEYMRNDASMLECLFGTPFAEGKIEFWDAPSNPVGDSQYTPRGWLDKRNTYLVKSVAIDPETGTAEPHKLYTFEVAPTGLRYDVTVVGQNLSNEELGLLLFGLESFNSDVYPVTIGAMSGRGFGRMKFSLKEIYCLRNNDLKEWIKNARNNENAGYYSLKNVTNQKEKLISEFKNCFNNQLGEE